MRIKHGIASLVWLAASAAAQTLPAGLAPPTDPARRLALLLRNLDRGGRLLYVTAHPDDEDAGLLAYLTHGRGVECALLTLTRGEGGQNELGPELFGALGALRSRELQRAGEYLGLRQYFSRALDFGYSFSVEESYAKWGEAGLLRDIEAVIREFRPDVIITLSPGGAGGGQHHQASARLVRRVFERSPHTARRLFRQVWEAGEEFEVGCAVELGIYDPVLGCTYAELGDRARGMHRCQGMVRMHPPFEQRRSRLEWLAARDEPLRALADPFDGLAVTAPLPEGLVALAERARRTHSPGRPDELVPLLLQMVDRSSGPHFAGLRARLGEALQLALGLRIAARAGARFTAAGARVPVELVAVHSAPRALDLRLTIVPADSTVSARLEPGQRWRHEVELAVGAEAVPTIARAAPAGPDELPGPGHLHPAWTGVRVAPLLEIEGRSLRLPGVAVEYLEVDSRFPSLRAVDLHVVPDPSLRVEREVLALPLGADGPRSVGGELLVSSLEPGEVDIEVLAAGEGWAIHPRRTRVQSPGGGREQPVAFRVERTTAAPGDLVVRFRGRLAGSERQSTHGYRRIEYPHIRPAALLVKAQVQVRAFPCTAPRERRVGYVEGVGDEIDECLAHLGIEPRPLSEEDLLEGDLDRFDVILTGVRAYKVRPDLRAAHPRLMEWAARGGALLVQYNKFEFNFGEETSPVAPFPARVGRRRVTVEESSVKLLHPGHSLFQRPNALGVADWEGWVQERGLYFLDVLDERYLNLLELADPWPYNPGPQGGSLVVARVGEGHWVYVGLALFRQLPAGVPGAYRLLANLLAL